MVRCTRSLIGTTRNEKPPEITIDLSSKRPKKPSSSWRRPAARWPVSYLKPIPPWSGRTRTSAWKSVRRTYPTWASNLHLEFLAFFQSRGKARQELRNLFQVGQAHNFNRRMHVAVGQADEGAGDAAAGPKDHVGVGPAGSGGGFVLERDLLVSGNLLDARHHFRVIAPAMSQGGARAHLHVAMLRLVNRRIIGRMRHVHDQCHVRFERVGN